MSDKHTCGKLIYHSPWSSSPCGKTAGYEYAGKWYRKMHHPPTVKARQNAKDEDWRKELLADKARRAAESTQRQLGELAPQLAQALEFCTDRLASVATDGVLREAIESARALIGRVREIEGQNK